MEGVSSSTLITIYVDLVSIPNHISSSQTNFKSRFKTDFKVQKSSSKMQKANFKIVLGESNNLILHYMYKNSKPNLVLLNLMTQN